MPVITLEAILLILVIYIICKIFKAVFVFCFHIAITIKEGSKKLFKGIWTNKPVQDTPPSHDIAEKIQPPPENHASCSPPRSRKFGISGKCEICGEDFLPVNSPSENHLTKVSIDFYGKSRIKILCGKCRKLMLEDSNCTLKGKN